MFPAPLNFILQMLQDLSNYFGEYKIVMTDLMGITTKSKTQVANINHTST